MNPPLAAQYRPQYQNQRSPHVATPRRGGPGPMNPAVHQQAAPTPAQVQAQQAAAAHERELAKRRSRKPMDKNIPEGVEDFVVGDGVQHYKNLRELERRLDATMMRKRLDMQDAVNRNVKRYKTLRISISNSLENQPWQQPAMDGNTFEFSHESQPTFRMKVEGRVIDEDDEASDTEDEEEQQQANGEANGDAMDHDAVEAPKAKKTTPTGPPRTKLSHFFKSIHVDFERSKSLHSDALAQVEWKKPLVPPTVTELPPAADFDVLEIERKSDENINCTLTFVRDETPERFRLSKELAEVLDAEEMDRAGAVMGIWEYVKAMGLQEDEERRGIRCDERLRAVFRQDQVFFPYVPDLIMQQNHLLPLPPLKLPYTIRVDPVPTTVETDTGTGTGTGTLTETPVQHPPTIYDIRVPVDDPLRAQLTAAITNPAYPTILREINNLDDQIALTTQALAHSKAKHGFLSSMSKDPVGFLRRWTSSQKRDLEVILGESTRGGGDEAQGDEWRRGGTQGVWGTEGVRESVELWLARAK
ncbi:MAG: hypothetical protein M1838_003745 [Thelocarpon superellum]|nr:MAG: hypothetical protein M1838_003745 [Thelocarpon superellum]